MIERVPMTREGYGKLQSELDQLKKVERRKVVRDIEEARAHGDISENAEFHAAKERQSFVEGRIVELTSKINRAEVINPADLDHEYVVFGATVKLEDLNSGDVVSYQIVGEDEGNVEDGKISVASPIARALIGKEPDAEVKVRTPGGVKEFIILDISFG